MMQWTFRCARTDRDDAEVMSTATTFYGDQLEDVREQFDDFLRGCGYVIDYDLDGDGWIPWTGGECPVDRETHVDVRYRCGGEQHDAPARIYRWGHRSTDTDIIAYRISK